MQAIHFRENPSRREACTTGGSLTASWCPAFHRILRHSGDSKEPRQPESRRCRSARRRTACGLRCRWEVCDSRFYGQLGLPATSTTFTASRNGRSAWRCNRLCYRQVPRHWSSAASSFFSVGSRSAVSQPFSILMSGSFACNASIPLSVTLVCHT